MADVAAHGMARPSFVPPPPIRELRELTRYRKTQIDAKVAEIQRLEKVLQDAGIKLTSVASKVLTQSGRAMIDALIAGEQDPKTRAELAKGKMRPKIPALTEALTGHFGTHHAVAARRIMDHLDFLGETIAALSAQIDLRTAAFGAVYDLLLLLLLLLLLPVPGLDRLTYRRDHRRDRLRHEPVPHRGRPGLLGGSLSGQQRVSREATPRRHHTRQPVAATGPHRRCPRRRANQGQLLRGPIPPDRPPTRPEQSSCRGCPQLIDLVWHLLSTGEVFEDLGDDYFQRRNDPDRQARRLVVQLQELGFAVNLTAA
ncbi:MAG: hypothetical protein ACYCYQ_15220 [Acidimicrobiales bacterium]